MGSAAAQDFFHPAKGGAYVQLRVSPGAKSTAVKGLYGEGAVRLSIAAPPVEGKANAEVERCLARLLELSRSEVTVVQGVLSHDKLVFINETTPQQIRARLEPLL